jgi:RimJ/RimL family protein N-acetyltransferase
MTSKKKKPVVIARATEEDALDYYAKFLTIKESMPSMIAWCGKVDGKIIGFGGYYKESGRWIAFCNLDKEALRYKIELHRAAIVAMKSAKAKGIRYLYAELDSENEGASRWLQRLGFHLDPRTLYYFRWRAN